MTEALGILREYARLKKQVRWMLNCLTEEEERIIEMMYIVPRKGNLARLCEEFEIEKSTVYRWRDRALRKLETAYRISQAGSQPGRQEGERAV